MSIRAGAGQPRASSWDLSPAGISHAGAHCRWLPPCLLRPCPPTCARFPYVKCLADNMSGLDSKVDGCASEQGWQPADVSGCADGGWRWWGGGSAGLRGREERCPGVAAHPAVPAWRCAACSPCCPCPRLSTAAGEQGKQLEQAAAQATWALQPRHTFVPWVRCAVGWGAQPGGPGCSCAEAGRVSEYCKRTEPTCCRSPGGPPPSLVRWWSMAWRSAAIMRSCSSMCVPRRLQRAAPQPATTYRKA